MTKFQKLKFALDNAKSANEVQDIIFQIADEKINVAMGEDKPLMYAETSYLHQLEKYAGRRVSELPNERFGFLNAYFIESRRILDRELHNEIKNRVCEKVYAKNRQS